MGRKHRQALLTVNEIQGIERVICDGESHRVVLLTDGQIALPDHNRRLLRLDDEMRRQAKLPACGCLKRVRELGASLKAGWTGAASEFMPELQRDPAKPRYNAQTRPDRSTVFNAVMGDVAEARKRHRAAADLPADPIAMPFLRDAPTRGYAPDGCEPYVLRDLDGRLRRTAERTFRGVVTHEVFGKNYYGRQPAIKIRPFEVTNPECIEALKKSPGGKDVRAAGDFERSDWTFFFDVVRWYTKVYRTGRHLSKGVLILRDAGGGRFAAFRATPGKQSGRVASATIRSDGEVLLKGGK